VFGDEELGYINKEQLDSIITQRCVDVAAQANATRLHELMMDYVTEHMEKTRMSPLPQDIKIILNFGSYPFEEKKINQLYDEYNDVFSEMGVEVQKTHYTMGELNKVQLQNVSTLFIYDWLNWLNVHQDDVAQQSIHCKLYVPKLLPMPKGGLEHLPSVDTALRELRMTPYDLVRRGLGKHLDIAFIDTQFWCESNIINNPIVEYQKEQ
jgi:hypothetical protein